MSEIVDNLKKLCEEHEKQLNEIRQRINDIEYIPLAKSLVGKCFKYPSGSSGYFGFPGVSPRMMRKKTYVYKRIIGHSDEYVLVDSFHMEHAGKIEITFGEKEYVTHFINKTIVPISEKEYFKAFHKTQKYIFERGKEGKGEL